MISLKRTVIALLAALSVIGATAELITVSQPVKRSIEAEIDINEIPVPPTRKE